MDHTQRAYRREIKGREGKGERDKKGWVSYMVSDTK